MSVKIGHVDPSSAIPPHALGATGTPYEERRIQVWVSEAGVELCAGPCVLTAAQAEELRTLLSIAVTAIELRDRERAARK